MTQLSNRFDILERLDVEESRAQRSGAPCSVIMLDVDHFKRVNDSHGHAAGDEVLKAIAATLSATLRGHDLVGRWGGEEFLIVLPNDTLAEGGHVAERIRKAIEAMRVRVDGAELAVTVSQGVSVFDPVSAGEMSMAIKGADKALYLAKERGRNRVEFGIGMRVS